MVEDWTKRERVWPEAHFCPECKHGLGSSAGWCQWCGWVNYKWIMELEKVRSASVDLMAKSDFWRSARGAPGVTLPDEYDKLLGVLVT